MVLHSVKQYLVSQREAILLAIAFSVVLLVSGVLT